MEYTGPDNGRATEFDLIGSRFVLLQPGVETIQQSLYGMLMQRRSAFF